MVRLFYKKTNKKKSRQCNSHTSMLTIHCTFPDHVTWHAKYQRNNKRGGHKNLRCFPYCGPDRLHHENGFCGNSVLVDAHCIAKDSSYSTADLRLFGEFATRDDPSSVRFPPGSIFTQHDVDANLRTDFNQFLPLMEPKEIIRGGGEGKRRFAFESQKKGWHYEWKGTKYTSEMPHAFLVYVAVEKAPGTFQCLAKFYSSAFSMFCRRRHKTVPEADKHLMASPLTEEEGVFKQTLGPDGMVIVAPRAALRSKPVTMPRAMADDDDDDEEDDGDDNDEAYLAAPLKKKTGKVGRPPKNPLSLPPPPVQPLEGLTRARKSSVAGKKVGRSKRSLEGDGAFGAAAAATAAASTTSDKKKKRKRTNKESNSDEKVMRVLAAIANLDKLKRRINADVVEEAGFSEDLDMGWLDALAGPIQEAFFPSVTSGFFNSDGDSAFFQTVDDIFDFSMDAALNSNQSVGSERARAVEVVEDLARYLVAEDKLTTTIQEAVSHRSSYSEFVQIIQKYIEEFLKERFDGMTIDDLDSALRGVSTEDEVATASPKKEMKSAFETLVSAALMRDADENRLAGGGGGASQSKQYATPSLLRVPSFGTIFPFASGGSGDLTSPSSLMGGFTPGSTSFAMMPLTSPLALSFGHTSSTNGTNIHVPDYPLSGAPAQSSSSSLFGTMDAMNEGVPSSSTSTSPVPSQKQVIFPLGITLQDFFKPPRAILPKEQPDVGGVWIRPDENEVELGKMRQKRDVDWIQRELAAKMEKRFELDQPRRDQVIVRLSPKLLSSGLIVCDLDGVEKPFGLSSPLGPSSGTLGAAKTLTTWAVGPVVCFRNTYDAFTRMMRCIWRVGMDELHGVHVYQSRKGGAWDPKSEPGAPDMHDDEGWEVVHVTYQVCTRDKSTPVSSARNTTSGSDAEGDRN